MDLFADIADERRLTADLLATLTDEQWATPSLCEGWTVHDVAAHLLMPLVTSTWAFAAAMLRHRMNFDRANADLTSTVAKRSNRDIVDGLRQHAEDRFTPPGLGPSAPLTDLLIHGEDIRRPLGMTRNFESSRLIVALDFLASGSRLGFVPPSRLTGLRLAATDLNWSFGEGVDVRGPAESLMLAIAGRPAALPDLAGEGVAELAGRIGG
jgi:uncharacterized protein (TIGR03083 family)